jgi:hypothetical protein
MRESKMEKITDNEVGGEKKQEKEKKFSQP